MNETSNNPIALEQYNSINPTDIRSGGFTIQNLITRQFDRVDFLLTLGTAKMPGGGSSYMEEIQVTNAVQRGLRTIESYLYPFIKNDEEYQTQAKEYKAMLSQPLATGEKTEHRVERRFYIMALWQDLIVSRLGNIDLLPQKRTEIEFD